MKSLQGVKLIALTITILYHIPSAYADFACDTSSIDNLAMPINDQDDSEWKEYIYDRLQLWEAGQTLKICFYSNSNGVNNDKANSRIADIAKAWTRYARIIFNFGDDGMPPRICVRSKDEKSEIRISYEGYIGHKSKIGTANSRVSHDLPTMYLNELDNENKWDAKKEPEYNIKELQHVVLHEFGHVLGLDHEHQHPKANCEFNRQVIMAEQKYTEEQFKKNFDPLPENSPYVLGKFDKLSVMMYNMKPHWFLSSKKSPCYLTDSNHVLSSEDKDWASSRYAPLRSENTVGPSIHGANITGFEKAKNVLLALLKRYQTESNSKVKSQQAQASSTDKFKILLVKDMLRYYSSNTLSVRLLAKTDALTLLENFQQTR